MDWQTIQYSLQRHHSSIDNSILKHQSSEKNLLQIIEVLEGEYGYSETEDQTHDKDQKLIQLREIIRNWISDISKEQNIQSSFRGDLLFFGSYKLKVNSHDSDIDTVCLVPYFVERDRHFFKTLVSILSSRPEVSEIFAIKEASVPIIKMTFSGILFDLSFARAPSQFTGDHIDFTSNQLLLTMDERSYRSFNGCRVADWLTRNENIKNYKNFQITLKCIKLWASNRGIYSNMIGYLSGIGWTILVAKVCQLYPNYPPNSLIERFFFLFSRWKWSDFPVIVENISEDVANPKLNADQWLFVQSSMMIITPCFPCMNCSHNVSQTTLRVIQEQFNHAYKVITAIQKGEMTYSDLFKPYYFFKKYKHFLQVSIVATNKQDFLTWKGHVESRLRKLTKLLETHFPFSIIQFHPYPTPFEYTPSSTKQEDEFQELEVFGNEKLSDYCFQVFDGTSKLENETEKKQDHKTNHQSEEFKKYQKEEIENLKREQCIREKYKFRCIYYYGIKFINKSESIDESKIDLREPIGRFIDQLSFPSMEAVPTTMNIFFKHCLRNQINFREKDLEIFLPKNGKSNSFQLNQNAFIKPKWSHLINLNHKLN